MRELFRRLKAEPFLFFMVLFASLFISLLALASPLFVIQVLVRYCTNGVDSTLITLTIGVLIAIALEFAFRQVRLSLARGFSARQDALMAGGAFATLTGSKIASIEQLPPGLRREIMNSLATVQHAYSPDNLATVLDACFAFMLIGALFLLNFTIAIIVSCFLIVMFLFAILSHNFIGRPIQDLNNASVRNNSLVGSAIQAADSIRSFNATGFLKQVWGKQQAVTNELRRKVLVQQGISQSITMSTSALMTVAVIAVGATYVVAGEMNVGVLIGANILASRALAPISRFAQLGGTFTKAQQSLEVLERFGKLPREAVKGSALKNYSGRLELKDLAFMYRGSSGPLFESTSLQLPKGSLLVVSGGNGSGKTTMSRLIMGLLEPTRGQIFVDGLDLRQVQPEWWRRQVIYMPQEPTFFDGTIRENLITNNPGLGESEILNIIQKAGLKRFLDESPNGLETMMINGGVNLALGIRRRLALARALTSNGMLAIFDEPAEGMDAEGGATVFKVMNELLGSGRTLIVCSHNPNIFQGKGRNLDLNSKPVPKVSEPSMVRNGTRRTYQ
ncbi:ATP-binding cassette domain-containing protein [Thermodesulfobacteriota bacterium]